MDRPEPLAVSTDGIAWADHLLRPPPAVDGIVFPVSLDSTVRVQHLEVDGWVVDAHLLVVASGTPVMACLMRVTAPDGWAGAFVCGTINSESATMHEEIAREVPALADVPSAGDADPGLVAAARGRILPVLRSALTDPDGWAAGYPKVTTAEVAGWASVGMESARVLRSLYAAAVPDHLLPMPVQFYEMALGGWVIDEVAVQWWHAEATGRWTHRHANGLTWSDIARLRAAGWTPAGVKALYREAGIDLAAPSWMGTGTERLRDGHDQQWHAEVALWEDTVSTAYAERCLDAGLSAVEVAHMKAAGALPDEESLAVLAALRGQSGTA